MIGELSTTCACPAGPASTGKRPSLTQAPTKPDAHSGGSTRETNDADVSSSRWQATRARRSHRGRSASGDAVGPGTFEARTVTRVTAYGETGRSAEPSTRTRTGSHTRTSRPAPSG